MFPVSGFGCSKSTGEHFNVQILQSLLSRPSPDGKTDMGEIDEALWLVPAFLPACMHRVEGLV
jgi:hypothetical protein